MAAVAWTWVEAVGEGVEGVLVEQGAADKLWLGVVRCVLVHVGYPLGSVLGSVLALPRECAL